MSLKIDRVGIKLIDYTYTVAVTIIYLIPSNYNFPMTMTRVYELYIDQRHSTTGGIISLVNKAFAAAQNCLLKIKTDKARTYVHFTNNGNYDQYTGNYY